MAATRDPLTGSEAPDPPDLPEEFERAAEQLRAAAHHRVADGGEVSSGGRTLRPEVRVEEVPGPRRVAPYSVALTADVLVDDDELGTGRFVLLYDPDGQDAWHGTFRCVTYVRAAIDAEMVTDPLLGTVGWSWLTDALAATEAEYDAPSGTVTCIASESFGGMADESPRAELEVRASWSPVGDPEAIARHVLAWGTLLCAAAGLPPVPSGVAVLPTSGGRAT